MVKPLLVIAFGLVFAYYSYRLNRKPKNSLAYRMGSLGGVILGICILASILLRGSAWYIALGGVLLGVLLLGVSALLP